MIMFGIVSQSFVQFTGFGLSVLYRVSNMVSCTITKEWIYQ